MTSKRDIRGVIVLGFDDDQRESPLTTRPQLSRPPSKLEAAPSSLA